MTNAYTIPPDVRLALDSYAKDRRPPGGFLTAVLENNLARSLARADDESYKMLAEIVRYMVWEIPGECWGSREKVTKWLEARV